MGDLLDSKFAGAAKTAGAIGYSLKSITHTNNSTYYILEPNDPKSRPWGTYVFYLGDDKEDAAIEVPHPVEEKNSNIIAIKSFIDGKATSFLLSGSRKGKGDVAINSDSIFQAVHEASCSETTTAALQIHCFNKNRYPQVVLTSGTSVAITAMDGLVDQLINNNLEVGIFDGNQFSDLGSTENEQAKFTNGINGSFIAVFLNRSTHTSKIRSNLVIESISEYTLAETTSSETTSSDTST